MRTPALTYVVPVPGQAKIGIKQLLGPHSRGIASVCAWLGDPMCPQPNPTFVRRAYVRVLGSTPCEATWTSWNHWRVRLGQALEGELPNRAQWHHPAAVTIWTEWLERNAEAAVLLDDTSTLTLRTVNVDDLTEAVQHATSIVPEGTQHLHIELVSRDQRVRQSDIIELMGQHPHLASVRLCDTRGTVIHLRRDGSKETFRELESDDPRMLGTDYPDDDSIHYCRLSAQWQVMNAVGYKKYLKDILVTSGHATSQSLINQLLSDSSLNDELQRCGFAPVDCKSLEQWISQPRKPIPFPLLRRYVEACRGDIRRAIMLSNRHFFDVDSALWDGTDYPLYIEDDVDKATLLSYRRPTREAHLGQGSFGWFVFKEYKNPANYFTRKALAKDLLFNASELLACTRNELTLGHKRIARIADRLGRPACIFIDAYNATFYPDLPLLTLFMGQSVMLYSRGTVPEEAMVSEILTRDAHIGPFAFAARHALEGSPSSTAFCARFGRDKEYVGYRERGLTQVAHANLHEWLILFAAVGVPAHIVKAMIEAYHGIPANHVAYLLEEALQGDTYERISERSGIPQRTITDLLRARRSTSPRVIYTLTRHWDQLPGMEVYKWFYPLLAKVIPEAACDEPHLPFSIAQVVEAVVDFDLREWLFHKRMSWPGGPKGPLAMAKEMGMKGNKAGKYYQGLERIVMMLSQARQLAGRPVDRSYAEMVVDCMGDEAWKFILQQHPYIVGLFPLRDPATGDVHMITDDELQMLMAFAHARKDPRNMRDTLAEAIEAHTKVGATSSGVPIKHVEELQASLGVSRDVALTYWSAASIVTPNMLPRLMTALPTLSFRAWYEHIERAALAYFLGTHADGSINYEMPSPEWNWDKIMELDIKEWLRLEINKSLLPYPLRDKLRPRIRNAQSLKNELVEILTTMYPVETRARYRRLLFMLARRDELYPIAQELGLAT
jgi:hypothetical protein